jgi:hypothetical protein
MDFSSFVTPTSIVALFIVVVTLLLRLFMDARDIQADAKIAQNLRNLGRKHAQQKVTVVVELGKRADSITPLLDHLFSSPYKKLEVIVLIKHTAGKNAKRQLELYRQHRQIKNLRLVSARAGISIKDVVRRYSTGKLVTTLTADQRLSKNFYTNISVDFVFSQPDVVLPRRSVRLSRTVTSALQSQIVMWMQFVTRSPIATTQKMLPGIIYSRKALLATPRKSLVVTRSRFGYISQPANTRHTVAQQLYLVLALIVAAVLSALIANTPEVLLLACIFMGAYLLTYIGSLSKIPHYSLLERLCLVLIAPLLITYLFVIAVARIGSKLRHAIKK